MSARQEHMGESTAPQNRTGFNDNSGAALLQALRYTEATIRGMESFMGNLLRERGIEDLNGGQAIMLWRMHRHHRDAHTVMRAGDLVKLGIYNGSNVTYNLKALVGAGYIDQATSHADRRTTHIHLSEKGQKIADLVEAATEAIDATLKNTHGLQDVNVGATLDGLSRIARVVDEIAAGHYMLPPIK